MNLKIENAKYTTERGTINNERDGRLTFNADITDLDNELFEGTLPYTFVDYTDRELKFLNDDIFNVRKYIKSKLNEIKIENFKYDNDITTLYNYREIFNNDIDNDCNLYIKSYDVVYFDNDVFDYSLDSQNIISNFINNYDHLIKEGKTKKEDVSQDFISCSNTIHKLSYEQMIELFNLMVTRYSEIKLYARALKDKINKSEDIDAIKNTAWDLWIL